MGPVAFFVVHNRKGQYNNPVKDNQAKIKPYWIGGEKLYDQSV